MNKFIFFLKQLGTFLIANKVFFSGLAASVAVVIQQFLVTGSTDWKAIGFACFMACLSYLANCWRGQGITITGVVGTLADVFVTNYNGGHVNVSHMILLSLIAIVSAVAPPAKNESYETNPVIEKAKTS